MNRFVLALTAWMSVVLAEPPVPQGLYGAPGGFGLGGYPGGNGGGSPSSQYGVPGGFGSGGYPGSNGGAGGRSPSSQYGAPGFGSGGGYSGGVGGAGYGNKDPRDTPMFSHEQDFQRPRGEIWGKWTVALPDGRIQRVEYDADETGFHPIITFDEPGAGNGLGGNVNGGYSGGGNGNGGYGGGQGGYR